MMWVGTRIRRNKRLDIRARMYGIFERTGECSPSMGMACWRSSGLVAASWKASRNASSGAGSAGCEAGSLAAASARFELTQ